MIPEPGDLLIHFNKPLLELLSRVVLGAGEPTEFLSDIRMELVVISQPEQVGLDEVEDVLFYEVCRHRVPLWASILVTGLVRAAGVIAGLVALPARLGCPGESSVAYTAEDATGEEIVALHGIAAMVSVFGL